MAELSFYHSRKDDSIDEVILTKEEERNKNEDWEDIRNQREYRDRHIDQWRRAAWIYNVIQNGSSDDRIANIVLGYTRMIVDTGIAQISEGEPEFDFRPVGPSDSKKTILWRDMTNHIKNRSNYKAHQNVFLTDWHVFGTGVMEVYTEFPHRTIRIPKGSGYEEVVVRDFRRPKVGVRAVSPFRVTRNPTVTDPNEVPSCTKEEILSWNQFVQSYGRAKLPNGKSKYKNTNRLPAGSHVKITKYWDELRDVYRVYALSYGNKSDGFSDSPPEELGVPIFDRPLKIHEIREKGETLRSEGLNIQGQCPLIFAHYNDQYTLDGEAHDVYGMGLPQHIEGMDTLIQTFFNMTVDNWRLSNTVLLSYQGNGASVPDFDATEYYGGELFEGNITPVPLGASSTRDFNEITQILNNISIPMTGINFNQIVGDTSKTAFEFAQRIRANNRRAEQKLKVLEEGAFKRLGSLLLAAGLSELTVPDLEAMTEEQVKIARDQIKEGRATAEDFEDLNGQEPKRRIRELIPVTGMKEAFDVSKTRQADERSVENTLVSDDSGEVNFIPAVEEYVYPAEYIEKGTIPDVIVDSKRMLGDLKTQDVQMLQGTINMIGQLSSIDPSLLQRIDVDSIVEEVLKFAQIDPEKVYGEEGNSEISAIMDKIQELKDVTDNPPQDVQPINPQGPAFGTAGSAGAQDPVEATAQGAL